MEHEEREAFKAEIRALQRQIVDRDYMIHALLPMLGPKAMEVWERWARSGVTRIHFAWAPGADVPQGEAHAEMLLGLEMATDSAEPFEVDDSAASSRTE